MKQSHREKLLRAGYQVTRDMNTANVIATKRGRTYIAETYEELYNKVLK